MEIQQFINQFGDESVISILANVPEIVCDYPKSAAYSTRRLTYILTHVSEKKSDEIYLHELRRYADEKKLDFPEILKRDD